MTSTPPNLAGLASLSADELSHYQEQGFVIPRFRLSGERVGQLREALDRVITDNPDRRPEQLVSVHISGKNAEGVTGHDVFMDIAQDTGILEDILPESDDDFVMSPGPHVNLEQDTPGETFIKPCVRLDIVAAEWSNNGSWQWVQVVDLYAGYEYDDNAGNQFHRQGTALNWLDVRYPYDYGPTLKDSPGFVLNLLEGDGYEAVIARYSIHAKSTVMWKADDSQGPP